MRVEGVPLANAVSDERLDGNLALLGIEHREVVEGDRALDAEGLGLAVPLDAAFVEPVERVRATFGSNRDAQTRIRRPVTGQSGLIDEAPAVDRTAPGERVEEVLDRSLVSQRDGGLDRRLLADRIPPQQEPQLGRPLEPHDPATVLRERARL